MEREIPKRPIFMPTLLSTIMVQRVLDFAWESLKQFSHYKGQGTKAKKCCS